MNDGIRIFRDAGLQPARDPPVVAVVHGPSGDPECGLRHCGDKSVSDLLFPMVAAELVFANLLLSLPKPDFSKLPGATLDELFGISEQAGEKIGRFLETATAEPWNEVIPLGKRDIEASRRKILARVFFHGAHHRGPMAYVLRQIGFEQDWVHDILVGRATS